MSTCIVQRSGTRLTASPPRIRPRLIDGPSNSSAAPGGERELARSRGRGRARAAPRSGRARGSSRGPNGLSTSISKHQCALRLHADVEIGGLAADRRTLRGDRHPPGGRSPWPRARFASGLLVRHDQELGVATPRCVSRASDRSASAASIPARRALHVIGAAPPQAPALPPRGELVGAARDDVEVARPDHPPRPGAGVCHHRRQPVDLHPLVAQAAGVEPAADERRGLVDALRPGGVERDQALGQLDLVDGLHPTILAEAIRSRPH